ncbi:hypothetical protein [Streptomyces pini]|uniref:HEAT repeat-containing protein n=1 Tax=Streptomyces pini TaxID=1520580 RepID=A0A1I3TY54_9ACTN|nr:hypothetical protein [Streptomyces pini]SFJ76228.1 hypothetical protein SAMN05192584_101193 [Streptomyces pini]
MNPVPLPDPTAVLAETDWCALEHAYGSAEDTHAQLIALLDADQGVRSRALEHLDHAVLHQTTLYSATAPAALYVAGVLSDPRTAATVNVLPRTSPAPLRAELLDWLGSAANEVTDEAESISRHHGFPPEDYPPFGRIREIRPALFAAVSDCLGDPDPQVREAAIAACIPLLDDPHLLSRRTDLIPLLRETLVISARWQYRDRAIEALAAWGEDTTGLEVRRDPFGWCDTPPDLSTSGWDLLPEDRDGLPF